MPDDPSRSAAPLLDPRAPARVSALLDEGGTGADGWLLYDFRDQNPLAHAMLGLGKTTRRAFVLFRKTGEPILLRHAIEASSWRDWSWESRSYAGWEELEGALASLLEGMKTVAMEVSPRSAVPTVDRVPSGVVELVRETGVEVVTSGDLVSHFHSGWGATGLESHRRAADVVRAVAHEAFERVAAAVRAGSPLREGEVMAWINDTLRERGLPVHTGCIVAIGRTAADPHYSPAGAGEAITAGVPLLIDLWGAEPGGIPADQSWMAYLGTDPDPRTLEVWTAVRDARDRALDLLRTAGEERRELRGWEVDRAARDLLGERGLDRWFVHRLGHSIDRELHGSGPNLDDLETRDERRILPGTGFSVEPGVYIPGEIGVRSEVNVHWGEDGPEVTPRDYQRDLLLLDVTPVAGAGA
ncbi:MAG: aminopeptidase P family protein [Gemmatimonadales bacterium]|nr:MAG: aminopeptidase P family protein [Gemmatimonadales bacterium]